MEQQNTNGEGTPTSTGAAQIAHTDSKDPKIYAKLNWNITDNQLLEYTYMARKYQYGSDYYKYNFGSDATSDFLAPAGVEKENDEFSILKYTCLLYTSRCV